MYNIIITNKELLTTRDTFDRHITILASIVMCLLLKCALSIIFDMLL